MRAIPMPIPCARLDDLYAVQKLTDQEIVDLLVSEGHDATLKRVRSWRKRHGIQTLPRWARHEVPPIEGRLQSLLVGSMLGDGRLVRRAQATHYTENHCAAQRAYLEWKVGLWGAWVKQTDPIRPVAWKRGGRVHRGYRFNTVAHAALNSWRRRFYIEDHGGWKRVLPEVVDLVDEFALAIWYLDDGSAGWWPTITFGADEESREVAQAIFGRFGLTPRWNVRKGKTGVFLMDSEDTAERFLALIRPCVPLCMQSKVVGFGFQGEHYQVRQKMTPEVLSEMASHGVPIKVIARDLGVGATTVSRWLRKLGIAHPRKVGRPSTSGTLS